jgi:hypothetical protein
VTVVVAEGVVGRLLEGVRGEGRGEILPWEKTARRGGGERRGGEGRRSESRRREERRVQTKSCRISRPTPFNLLPLPRTMKIEN